VHGLFAAVPKLSKKNRIEELVELGILPAWFHKAPGKLARIAPPARGRKPFLNEKPLFVAGGTDLFVHPPLEQDPGKMAFLEEPPAREKFIVSKGFLEIDGRVTTQELLESPEIRTFWPGLPASLELVSSLQIRNRATIAGNFVNASPIGDISIIMLALGADVELASGNSSRRIPLESLFLGYKKLAKSEREILTRIFVPLPEPGNHFAFEKVSRRQHLDIASVNTALQIRVESGKITSARIAAGGVAPIPLLLEKTAGVLRGKSLGPDLVRKALRETEKEIAPISDIRGSAEYKRRLLRNLILTMLQDLFPEQFPPDAAGKLFAYKKRSGLSLRSLFARKR
jgi:xanthine dehydrogenase small subunit